MGLAGSGAMAVATGVAPGKDEQVTVMAPSPLGEMLLARVAVEGGATRSEIVGDLAPFFAHKLSPAEWRRAAEQQSGQLVDGGLATESRGRLKVTSDGGVVAARFFGQKQAGSLSWPQVRDGALIAKALGIEGESASRLKMLGRPEGLRALILQTAYKLPVRKNPSPAKLRAQLALVALERAFGNKIKGGLGKGSAFTAKAGRTLAGQLAVNARDFSTDQKLIAHLAAENAGAVQIELDALRAALLKKLGSLVLAAEAASQPKVTAVTPKAIPEPANDRGLPAAAVAPVPNSTRPDVAQFAASVQRAARARAEGWPGNRKAFISLVWQAIREAEPSWDLTEIEFKCMLAEAHRAGAVVLANADLKDKKLKAEFESSAISYKNTVWHFVRVED
jgi:hypothetical protein